MKKYINNWGKVDDFCIHITHPMIEIYPELIPKIKLWSHSKNKWLRRASAVTFITTVNSFYVTKQQNIKDIFEIAETLLYDKEYLVQKAYGWMLKATSINNQEKVLKFIMKYKSNMPRTALRYAIEKMPINLKKQVMK